MSGAAAIIRFPAVLMPSYPLVLCLTIAVVCSVGMVIATWTRIDLMPAGVSPGAIFHHGPGYVVVAAWTYFMLLLSLVFLLTAEVPNAALTRRGRAIVASSLTLPLLTHMAYLQRWTSPLGG